MFSLSPKQAEIVRSCISKAAKNNKIAAACVYGSRAAGYARPDSDIDVLLILEHYPSAIKYAYFREVGADVSILVVSKKSLEADARAGSLGEFAVGRLLHVYEPIENSQLLSAIERTYKRRVIVEELEAVVQSAGILATEISFPLDYIVFSKIKKRMSRYPNAVYSYYKTYCDSKSSAQNLQFALRGYRDALSELLIDHPEIFSRHIDALKISEGALVVDRGAARAKLAKDLQRLLESYIVHTYAGRSVMHVAIKEAESKIRRRAAESVELPVNMKYPAKAYWKLPEGVLITESRDWLDELAKSRGIEGFRIVRKKRMGNVNSRTVMYTLKNGKGAESEFKIAVKQLAKTKSVKWAALSIWTSPVKRFKVGPLFRLGTEYKSIRFLRRVGLHTPSVEAVVLDERLLVTSFIEGITLAEVIRQCLAGDDRFDLVRQAGSQIGRIHDAGVSLGNIKPKNIIVAAGSRLFFTDLEQFLFDASDQIWDLAQFISWGLKGTRNESAARRVTREFLSGYLQVRKDATNLERLAKSKRYIESFFPVLAPAVARDIKAEIRLLVASG